MQLKILLKWSLLISGTAGALFFLAIVFFLTHDLTGRSVYAKPPLSAANRASQNLIESASSGFAWNLASSGPSPGLPARLKIPIINVDAALEYVGLTQEGAMDIPKNQEAVAWFELGRRPGENGSAVIAGHYGWKNGKGSTFDNLYKLRKGDKLYVQDDKGTIFTFTVSKIRRYDPKADASDVFGSNDGKSHLNLVTCEGDWDKNTKSYTQRLVVFTDKE